MAIPLVGVRSIPGPRAWSRPKLAALTLWLVSVASLAATLWIWAGQHFVPPPVRFTSGPVMVGEFILSLAYVSVASILIDRRPRNVIGWAFMGMGATTALQMPVTVLVAGAHQVLRPIEPPILFAAWLASSGHLPTAAALAIMAFVVFPDGRPLSRRWLAPAILAVAGAAILATASGLSAEGLIWYPSLSNPFALPEAWMPLVIAFSAVGAVLVIAGLLLAVAAIVLRYRRADDVGQAQLRWIVYAIVLMALTGAPFLAVRYATGGPGTIGNLLLLGLVLASSFLPIAAAIAILRYRLFEIDVIINHTLVYVPLAAFLGGLFTALITRSQRLFVALTGNTSDIAVVLATLLVASVFTPVRKSLEGYVERHMKPHPAHSPVHEGSKGADLPALVEHLTDRLAELEARLEQNDRRSGGPAAEEGPRGRVPRP